jgi:hypothetical protein
MLELITRSGEQTMKRGDKLCRDLFTFLAKLEVISRPFCYRQQLKITKRDLSLLFKEFSNLYPINEHLEKAPFYINNKELL